MALGVVLLVDDDHRGQVVEVRQRLAREEVGDAAPPSFPRVVREGEAAVHRFLDRRTQGTCVRAPVHACMRVRMPTCTGIMLPGAGTGQRQQK